MEFLTFMKDYGGLIFTAVLVLAYLGVFIWKLIKKRKNKGRLTLSDIYEEIPGLVASAESLFKGEGMGEAKFNHVLTRLELDAVKSGFALDTAKVTDMINKIVDATKVVNVGITPSNGVKKVI